MSEMLVFDPPQCCSTGVCGPSVDPKLSRLAGDLDWLKQQGVPVTRYNLAQQPRAFIDHVAVKELLDGEGEDALPIFLLDGQVVSKGQYPVREALAHWAGIEAAPVEAAAESAGCCGGDRKADSSGCC